MVNENFVTMNPLHVAKTEQEHNAAIAYIADVEAAYGSMHEWMPNQKEDRGYILGEENGWTKQ